MADIYEVIVGSLNFRSAPNGPILATLRRASKLEVVGPPQRDPNDARATWLHVRPVPQGAPDGFVSDRYVTRVDAPGPPATGDSAGLAVSDTQLLTLSPTGKAWILKALVDRFAEVVEPYGILQNRRRLCHFLAQSAHESAGFRTLEEFGGATYWSRYEGRADLGNTKAGDGVLYHGRGIFQLTGRANYRSMGAKIGVHLEAEPQLAAEGDISLRTACEFWKSRRLETFADQNDIREITRRINGGSNGLADRTAFFRRAWSIWGDPGQPPPV